MVIEDVTDIESNLLIDAIFNRYGYDFKNYQFTSLKRRFESFRHRKKLASISELIPKIIYNQEFFDELLASLSVTVTEMYRDPYIFEVIDDLLIPQLSTYPLLNIWSAGCATGEEAYTLGIYLKEKGLLSRSNIYATDINEQSLRIARKGVVPDKNMQRYVTNYYKANGAHSLSDYFKSDRDGFVIDKEIMEKISFLKHNLVADGVFREMQLVVCKNVLIYFKKNLQIEVLRLLTESLCHHGFLILGDKESIEGTPFADHYEVIDKKSKIYKKKYAYS